MLDLHRHTEFSTFDGFGKTSEVAKYAKEIGYDALGISDHGNMSGLVTHYFSCKENGIKPIMGCEVYFMPKFKQTRTSYHLCLYIKNLKGYRVLNELVTKANFDNFYYKAIIDFDMLEKNHEGLICTSACIGGAISTLISKGKDDVAYNVAKRFKDVFGDDYYIEIQPYKLTEKGLQEAVNIKLMQLAKKLKIKCILTSDSHYINKDDFDTYLKMHDIAGHKDFGAQYEERYMPTKKELIKRFVKMHGDDSELFVDEIEAKKFAKTCIKNLDEISSKVDDEILEKLPLALPVFNENINSTKLLKLNIIKGLKKRGKYNKQYLDRCKEEFEVIKYHGFEDYFLMVQDYVQYARNSGIEVGPGRGSVCNSLVAYALGITDVDSIIFDLDFRRFLRKDKKKFPDIDMDFETSRRGEVIEYLVNKYESKAARICSYGLYKVDNLLNDLFKICGLKLADKDDPEKSEKDKATIAIQKAIKNKVKEYIDEETSLFNYDEAQYDEEIKYYNNKYDDIIKHFSKLYKKVRFFGTHAAGVAISGSSILNYTSIVRRAKDMYTTTYDLVDIENINVIKFDMLGLRTMSIMKELRDITDSDHYFNYDLLNDEKIYEEFGKANTDGIFQFEAKGAKNILKEIECDCYQDVIAASALNRPGPLSLGMVEEYANEKKNVRNGIKEKNHKDNIFFQYADDTYGTFVYQEQIMKVCTELGGMTWAEADKVMKFLKSGSGMTEKALEIKMQEEEKLTNKFVEGASKKGIKEKEAREIFNKLLVYSFNKGHAVGYALISIEQMFYKVYYNTQFWYVTLKYANEKDVPRLSSKAVKDGCVILLPHVNGAAYHKITKIDGDVCIREGTFTIKNVGLKAAQYIEEERNKNGKFKDYDDFYDRMEPYRRVVNKRVLEALKESGALEFDKKIYFGRCQKYNSALYGRG